MTSPTVAIPSAPRSNELPLINTIDGASKIEHAFKFNGTGAAVEQAGELLSETLTLAVVPAGMPLTVKVVAVVPEVADSVPLLLATVL